jgi:hypothetical protein
MVAQKISSFSAMSDGSNDHRVFTDFQEEKAP